MGYNEITPSGNLLPLGRILLPNSSPQPVFRAHLNHLSSSWRQMKIWLKNIIEYGIVKDPAWIEHTKSYKYHIKSYRSSLFLLLFWTLAIQDVPGLQETTRMTRPLARPLRGRYSGTATSPVDGGVFSITKNHLVYGRSFFLIWQMGERYLYISSMACLFIVTMTILESLNPIIHIYDTFSWFELNHALEWLIFSDLSRVITQNPIKFLKTAVLPLISCFPPENDG